MGGTEVPENRLRAAVQSIDPPAFLDARIRRRLRVEEPGRSWLVRMIPLAAAVVVFAALGIAYELGHLRLTVRSQETYIASVSMRVASLMRIGLGDHIHCAVFRKYPDHLPNMEEFIGKMNPQYAGLIPIVRSQVPGGYRMTLAHECSYHRRKFVHLSFMDDSNMLSVVIARKGEGESFETEGMLPALVRADMPLYQANVQRFQISAFETGAYLVYFISDLPKQGNTELMLALGPKVRDFLVTQE
jgi:hypothetical protein